MPIWNVNPHFELGGLFHLLSMCVCGQRVPTTQPSNKPFRRVPTFATWNVCTYGVNFLFPDSEKKKKRVWYEYSFHRLWIPNLPSPAATYPYTFWIIFRRKIAATNFIPSYFFFFFIRYTPQETLEFKKSQTNMWKICCFCFSCNALINQMRKWQWPVQPVDGWSSLKTCMQKANYCKVFFVFILKNVLIWYKDKSN